MNNVARVALLVLTMLLLAGCTITLPRLPRLSEEAPAAPPPPVQPAAPEKDEDSASVAVLATSEPLPPGSFAFAEGDTIAGVGVGGLDEAAAESAINARYAATLVLPVEIIAGDQPITVRPGQVGMQLDMTTMLEAARAQVVADEPVAVPLQLRYSDEATLREQLQAAAEELSSDERLEVLAQTDVISRSFVLRPAQYFDVERTIAQIAQHIEQEPPGTPMQLALAVRETTDPPRPTFTQIRQQADQMAAQWDGVVGMYIYDFATGTAADYNGSTVFSGASLMKIAILLTAYVTQPELDATTLDALTMMIVYSDNTAANTALGVIGGGAADDPVSQLEGVRTMNAVLAELGLQYTYMNVPYAGVDVLNQTIPQGPAIEGSPPYTAPDPLVRTTPAEISRLLILIEDCQQGAGDLLLRYPDTITPDDCTAMLDLLAANADDSRMVQGVPANVRVEHKSGWVSDMQADTGIVRSPGGDYLLTVFVWRDTAAIPDQEARDMLAALSRLVYTGYNPAVVSD